MKKLTILFLLIATSLTAQNEFAPLGANWKYTFHKFNVDYPYNCEYNICNQSKERLEVIDTMTIQGKSVSVLQQFWADTDLYDSAPIYIHTNNDSVYFYAQNEFHLLYDFTAKDGDTININVPNFYRGPGTYNVIAFSGGVDSIYNIDVIVKDKDSVMVSGQMRRVANYEAYSLPNEVFYLPNVIDNIGSGLAFFGSTTYFVSEGCFGVFICYEDSNQAYTPFGCCEFPADFPKRKFAPEGAEWLYEGWSDGNPNEDGCDNSCKGNYNLFRVEGEKDIGGRKHAKIKRYHRTKNSNWESTGDVIYSYDYDGGFYASRSNFYSFHATYRTDVSIGDTISSSAAGIYPKFIGDDEYEYGYPRFGGSQVVEAIETIDINGQPRLKITFRNLGDFRIGEVIEGIGPLFDGLLGYDQPIPDSGCAPRLICYRDSLITFTTTDCGCDFPKGPTSISEVDIQSVYIYPNPTSEFIIIDNQNEYKFKNISIINIEGQTIISTPFQNRIDISNLDQGIYFIKMVLNDTEIIKKFIKS